MKSFITGGFSSSHPPFSSHPGKLIGAGTGGMARADRGRRSDRHGVQRERHEVARQTEARPRAPTAIRRVDPDLADLFADLTVASSTLSLALARVAKQSDSNPVGRRRALSALRTPCTARLRASLLLLHLRCCRDDDCRLLASPRCVQRLADSRSTIKTPDAPRSAHRLERRC